MALRMGIAMEWSDVVGHCEYAGYESDVTDTESEEDEYAFTPMAFERAVVARRSTKRTYGVFFEREAGAERRKRSRIDEQLALLRAAIPNLCTNEKASILAGAYEYIEKLQRQVQELQSELDTEAGFSDHGDDDDDDGDDVSSCEDGLSGEEERPVDSNAALEGSCAECRGDSRPTVEVVRTEEGLKIHIQCERRPRVLADIMELLESSGMNVEQVNIAFQEDSQFVFDCVGSEVDGECIAADSGHVEACLRSLIADARDIGSPQ